MPSNFQEAVTLVLKHEGQTFVNDPNDEGGASKFGVSLRFYKSMYPDATADTIRNLTMGEAEDIYNRKFWYPMRIEEIESQKLANRLLDLAVNTGMRESILMLQRAINSLKCNYLVEDGIMGIKTIQAANYYPQDIVYGALINEATMYYNKISKIGHNSVFLEGWLTRLNDTP